MRRTVPTLGIFLALLVFTGCKSFPQPRPDPGFNSAPPETQEPGSGPDQAGATATLPPGVQALTIDVPVIPLAPNDCRSANFGIEVKNFASAHDYAKSQLERVNQSQRQRTVIRMDWDLHWEPGGGAQGTMGTRPKARHGLKQTPPRSGDFTVYAVVTMYLEYPDHTGRLIVARGESQRFPVNVKPCLPQLNLNYRGAYVTTGGVETYSESIVLSDLVAAPDEAGNNYAGSGQAAVVIGLHQSTGDVECSYNPPLQATSDATVTGQRGEEDITFDLQFGATSGGGSAVYSCVGGGMVLNEWTIPYDSSVVDLSLLGLNDLTFAPTGGTVTRPVTTGILGISGTGQILVTMVPIPPDENVAFGGAEVLTAAFWIDWLMLPWW